MAQKETGDPQKDATPIYDKAAQEYRDKNGVGPAAHVRGVKVEIQHANTRLNRY